MNSVFPQWFVDIATFTTVIGFFLTLWLLYEARHIRNSFLRRARLPQVTKELKAVSKTLSSHLKSWGTQKEDARNQLSISRALLENLIPKLPNEEQKKCKAFVKQLKPRKWLIIKDPGYSHPSCLARDQILTGGMLFFDLWPRSGVGRFQRWLKNGVVSDRRHTASRPEPANKLSEAERQSIL